MAPTQCVHTSGHAQARLKWFKWLWSEHFRKRRCAGMLPHHHLQVHRERSKSQRSMRMDTSQLIKATVSPASTRRSSKQMGFSSPHRGPLLSAKNRKQKLQLTNTHQKQKHWSTESVGSELGVNSMNAWIRPAVLTVHAAGGVMDWGIFSGHTLGPLVPTEHRFNSMPTRVLSLTVSKPLWPHSPSSDWLLVSHSSDRLNLVSWTWRWIHGAQMTSTVTDLSPTERLWDVEEAVRWCHIDMDQNLVSRNVSRCT